MTSQGTQAMHGMMDTDPPELDPWLAPLLVSYHLPSPMFDEFPVMVDSHCIVDAIKVNDEPLEFHLNNNNLMSLMCALFHTNVTLPQGTPSLLFSFAIVALVLHLSKHFLILHLVG